MADIRKVNEDAWFDSNQRELIQKAKYEKQQQEKEQLKIEESKKVKELKELHWMCCPKCGHEMKEIEIKGVFIDECTLCHGLYFDLGELETLLNKKLDDSKGFFMKIFGA